MQPVCRSGATSDCEMSRATSSMGTLSPEMSRATIAIGALSPEMSRATVSIGTLSLEMSRATSHGPGCLYLVGGDQMDPEVPAASARLWFCRSYWLP